MMKQVEAVIEIRKRRARIMNLTLSKRYWTYKTDYPDVLIMMRVGDFYEAYGPDAEKISKVACLTLTSRKDGQDSVPMVGFPVQSVEKLVTTLINLGHRICLVDQATAILSPRPQAIRHS